MYSYKEIQALLTDQGFSKVSELVWSDKRTTLILVPKPNDKYVITIQDKNA